MHTIKSICFLAICTPNAYSIASNVCVKLPSVMHLPGQNIPPLSGAVVNDVVVSCILGLTSVYRGTPGYRGSSG